MNERERIEFIINSYGLSPSQFAERTGIPRASVSHILGGRNKPSLEILQKVAAAFPDVDLQWLMLGIGDKPSLHAAVLPAESVVASDTLFPADSTVVMNAEQRDVAARATVPNTVREAPRQVRSTPKEVAVERIRKVRQAQPEENVRRIKEVRVFYSDGTYEILYPEKQ